MQAFRDELSVLENSLLASMAIGPDALSLQEEFDSVHDLAAPFDAAKVSK